MVKYTTLDTRIIPAGGLNSMNSRGLFQSLRFCDSMTVFWTHHGMVGSCSPQPQAVTIVALQFNLHTRSETGPLFQGPPISLLLLHDPPQALFPQASSVSPLLGDGPGHPVLRWLLTAQCLPWAEPPLKCQPLTLHHKSLGTCSLEQNKVHFYTAYKINRGEKRQWEKLPC